MDFVVLQKPDNHALYKYEAQLARLKTCINKHLIILNYETNLTFCSSAYIAKTALKRHIQL